MSLRPVFIQDGKEVDFAPPRTKYELQALVKLFFGFTIPDNAVCEGHTAPLDAIWHGFAATYPIIVWKASRGFGGKSTLLGTLSVIEMLTGMKVAVLGGSAQQSRRVHEIADDIWDFRLKLPDGEEIEGPLAHLLADTPRMMETKAKNGAWMRALTASTKSARGPHPQRLNLDEVDEMEIEVFDAAMGQTMMAGTNFIPGTVISSTHQYPDKTMTEVLKRAQERGWPVFSWCYKENLVSNQGWLPESEIARKKSEVTDHMFRVEYDLQEPSIEGRAVDSDAVDAMFQRDLGEFEGDPGKEICIEEPDAHGMYITGVDWARINDWTVITTWRIDRGMWRLVAFERLNRIPWPLIVERLNKRLDRYGGQCAHDMTGIGDFANDLVRHKVKGFVLMGRLRAEVWSDWIVAIENGEVEAPRIEWMHREYLYCTIGDLYGQGQSDHPPDSFVSGALAWAMRTKLITIPAPAFMDLTKTSLWTE